MKIHLIGICGTAMATLAAHAEAEGARRPRVRPGRLPADEHVPRGGGHPSRSPATTPSTSPPTSTSSSSATPSRAATPRSRRCSTGRSATARCPRRCASTSSGARGRSSSPARTARRRRRRLTAWLLTAAGLDPSVLVGGIAANFGEDGSSYRIGHGRDFVIEGDEYDSAFFDKTAKFLKYLPDIAVIGNIEFDHADIYADLDEIRLAFRRLVNLVPRARPARCSARTARRRPPCGRSRGRRSRRSASRRRPTGTRYDLRVAGDGTSFARAARGPEPRRVRGAAARARTTCGTRWRRWPWRSEVGRRRRRRIADGLARVRGREAPARGAAARWPASPSTTTSRTTRRRSPRRWPALRAAHPDGRIWAVFEPRSASSCRKVFQERSPTRSRAADDVIIAAVFRSNLPGGPSGCRPSSSSPTSAGARARRARYVPTVRRHRGPPGGASGATATSWS